MMQKIVLEVIRLVSIDWRSDNYYGMIFVMSVICFAIIAVIFMKVIRKRRSHFAMKKLTNPYIVMMAAMIAVSIVLAIGNIPYFFGLTVTNQQGVFFIGLTFYFILWIVGTNMFLKGVIRLPENRKRQFARLQMIVGVVIVLDILFAVLSFVLSTVTIENFDATTILEMGFAISALIGLVIFIYYRNALNVEIKKNASKLIKARIEMLKNAVTTQIVFVFVIAVGSTILFTNSGIVKDEIIETVMFFLLNIIGVINTFIIFNSIDIPTSVRVKYNITPRRFNFTVKV